MWSSFICWCRECLRQRRPRINCWRNIIAFLDGKWIQPATYILRRLFVLSRYPPTEILNLDNNFLCLFVCLSLSLLLNMNNIYCIIYWYRTLSLLSFQFNLQYLHSHVNAQTAVDSMNVESGKLWRHVKKYRKHLRSVRFNVDKIKDDG